MAHLVLFLRSAGLCDVGDELGVRLILKYVEVLITSRMTDLVAAYTAHLPPATQVTHAEYTAYLPPVTQVERVGWLRKNIRGQQKRKNK